MGNDNAYIEPVHLLAAMLRQDDGPRALLERAGVNVPGLLQAADTAIKKLPQVQGHDGVQVGPDLGRLLQATEKEAIAAMTSSLRANSSCWRWPTARPRWATRRAATA